MVQNLFGNRGAENDVVGRKIYRNGENGSQKNRNKLANGAAPVTDGGAEHSANAEGVQNAVQISVQYLMQTLVQIVVQKKWHRCRWRCRL
jgi:hypothetical protein